MNWTAVEFDFSKALHEHYKPKHIKIPDGFKISVNIELDEKVHKRILQDHPTMQRLQEIAQNKVKASIAAVAQSIQKTDEEADKSDRSQKTLETFASQVQTSLQKRMTEIGNDMQKLALAQVEFFKKSQQDLKDAHIKSGVKIVTQALAIAGSTAATVASHGALTPFSGIAIARSSVAIAQEITRLATDCSQKAKIIDAELLVIKKAMGENFNNASFMDKLRKNGAETAMAVLSGLIGVETPSVKNCTKHIEDHRIDIASLDKKSKEYSAKVDELMAAGQHWEQKIKEAQAKGKKQDKVAKLQADLKACEKALDHILQSTIKVHEGVKKAWENHKRFTEVIKKLSEGVQAWTQYVDVVVSATVDIGIAIGSPDKVLEVVVNTLIATSNDAVQAAAG
jgi:hypothetical protein